MGKTGVSLRRPRLVLLAVLLGCAMAAPGQELKLGQAGMHENLRRWGYQEGLPSIAISDLAETPDGYLWLATQEGLVRFNGREFFVFDTGNVPELRHNDVRCLLTARDGTLWLCGYDGDIVAYRDRAFTAVADRRLLPSIQITDLQEDSGGRIWIGTRKGLAVVEGNRIAVPAALARLAGQEIVAIARNPEGRLLIATPTAVFGWDGGELRPLHAERATILDVCADQGGRLWVATDQGLVLVDGPERRLFTAREGLPDILVSRLFLDRDGSLWIGTASGIAQIGRDQEAKVVAIQPSVKQSGIVRAFLQDRRGSVWLATITSLFRLSRDLFITYDTRKGLLNDLVTAVFCDRQGRLWIGNDGGLNRLDPDGTMTIVATADRLGNSAIVALCEDPAGQIWIGTERGLVRSGRRGFTFFTTRDGLPSDSVYALTCDRRGRLWVGTAAGYCVFDGGRLRRPEPGSAQVKENIFFIFESADERIWIGTRTRLFTVQAGRLEPVPVPGSSERPIFMTAFEEAPGTLWIGTYADGLYRVRDGRMSRIDEGKGLPGNTVYAILKDGNGGLWMSNNRGVFKVSVSELNACADGAVARIHPVLYGQSDGMKAAECNGGNSPSAARLPDGRLAFPTIAGLVIADPARELPAKSPPPVVIEKILADNRGIDPLQPARLPAATRMIEFSFVGLDLQEPENVQYRYRIDGLSSEWHDLGASGRLTLSNPGAGSYVVQIAASTSGREWSKTSARFAFAVRPHWYETRMFLLLAILAAAAAVVLGTRFRMSYLERRRAVLEAKVRQRTAELKRAKERVEQSLQQEELARRQLAAKNEELEQANQLKTELMDVAAHDLRSPLQLIMGYAELINLKSGHADYVQQKSRVIQETSERMSQLIQDLLQTSSLEAGNIVLNKTRVDLNRTARTVAQIYAPFIQQKQQTLQLVNRHECLVSADEDRLREIVENLVSNAVKYTPPGGSIRVITEMAGERCRVIIEDEGPGFTADDRRKLFGKFQKLSARPTGGESSFGLGLAIVKMLVELHEGDIQVESVPGKGCRFIVALPADPGLNGAAVG